MIPTESMAGFIIASTLLSFSPGPDNIFVLSQSALNGRKTGILITLGLCTGLIFHTAIVALGIAAIIKTSAVAFTLLKFLGAMYLCFLAWSAFNSSNQNLKSNQSPKLSYKQLYRRGVFMNITNPKVSLFFLAFLPQFTAPSQGDLTLQIFTLGALFMLTALIVFSSIAVLASSLGSYLKKNKSAQTYLNRITTIVFILLAIKLVLYEVNI